MIAPLPDVASADLLAPGEVLIQEGVTAWTLPSKARSVVSELRELFADRVVIGLRGRFALSDVDTLRDEGIDFLATATLDPELVTAANSAQLPVLAGALTISEIVRVWEAGAAGANVVPCDALGVEYAKHLAAEIPEISVVATGRIDAYMAEVWLEAGAAAVSPTADLMGNALSGGALAGLRVRCRDFVSAAERTRRG